MDTKMMKKLGAWTAVSFLLQCLMLLYINNVFLSNNKVFSVTGGIEVFNDENYTPTRVNANYKIPAGASDIKVSHDGAYISYVSSERLEIVDLAKKTVKKTFDLDKLSLSYYRWLPDRNRMIIVYKGVTGSQGIMKVYAYEVDNDNEMLVKDIDGTIDYIPRNFEVTDLQLSTLTNRIYIRVQTKGQTENRLYKIDIHNDVYRVYSSVLEMGRMALLNLKDAVYYEDEANHTVYRNDSSGERALRISGKYALLGVDADDNVYLGELNKEKVTAILSGNADTDSRSWKKTSLEQPAEPADIIISHDGKVYEKHDEIKTIVNIETHEKFAYAGKFIEMAKDYVISLNGDTINRVIFKK